MRRNASHLHFDAFPNSKTPYTQETQPKTMCKKKKKLKQRNYPHSCQVLRSIAGPVRARLVSETSSRNNRQRGTKSEIPTAGCRFTSERAPVPIHRNPFGTTPGGQLRGDSALIGLFGDSLTLFSRGPYTRTRGGEGVVQTLTFVSGGTQFRPRSRHPISLRRSSILGNTG